MKNINTAKIVISSLLLSLYGTDVVADIGKVITLKVPVNVSNFQEGNNDAFVTCYIKGDPGGAIPYMSKIPLVNGNFSGTVLVSTKAYEFNAQKLITGYVCSFAGSASNDAKANPSKNKPMVTEVRGDF